jgi:hypothetical protein
MHRSRLRRDGEVGAPDSTFRNYDCPRVNVAATRKRLLLQQGGKCAICRSITTKRWHLDHDHTCCGSGSRMCERCVRGVLCAACNVAIGLLRDDPGLIAIAATYVRGHRDRLT